MPWFFVFLENHVLSLISFRLFRFIDLAVAIRVPLFACLHTYHILIVSKESSRGHLSGLSMCRCAFRGHLWTNTIYRIGFILPSFPIRLDKYLCKFLVCLLHYDRLRTPHYSSTRCFLSGIPSWLLPPVSRLSSMPTTQLTRKACQLPPEVSKSLPPTWSVRELM